MTGITLKLQSVTSEGDLPQAPMEVWEEHTLKTESRGDLFVFEFPGTVFPKGSIPED